MIEPAEFSRRLIQWQQLQGRTDLPWQQDPTPYRVWLSEVMLQQTQVATVIPYFERFVARFPDLETLVQAELDAVLHLWSGLGYYARARHLHQTAVIVHLQHQGELPLRIDQLLSLPGIGRSTAGAILSLAAGQRHPILDGNVKRVLARCFAIPGWPGTASVSRQLWQLAERLTPSRHAAIYNQAIMDLGATLCRRASPDCGQCPLAEPCIAKRQGNPQAYPGAKGERPLPRRATRMLIVRDPSGRVLLEQRPPTGLWGGLWGFPECPMEESPWDWLRRRYHLECQPARPHAPFRHRFTHFLLEIHPWETRINDAALPVLEQSWVWYNLQEPEPLGVATPVSRLLHQLLEEG